MQVPLYTRHVTQIAEQMSVLLCMCVLGCHLIQSSESSRLWVPWHTLVLVLACLEAHKSCLVGLCQAE